MGNQRITALSLFWAAQQANLINQAEYLEKAAAYFAEAVPLLQAQSDNLDLAFALDGLGMANDRLGRKEIARDAYRRALPLMSGPRLQSTRAHVLLNLAVDEQALHDFAQASDDYTQVLPLFATPDEAFSRGLTLMGLGSVRQSLGDDAGALAAYIDAAFAWHSAQKNTSEAAAQLKIGALRQRAQAWQEALDAYGTALSLSAAAGDPGGQAAALIATAGVYMARGDNRRTLEAAERAMTVCVGDAFAYQRSSALLAAGLAARDLNENAKALRYFNEVIALGEQNPTSKAVALTKAAGIYTATGDPRKALEFLDEARRTYQQQHTVGIEDMLGNDIGLAYSALGRKADALQKFDQSLAAARRDGNLQAQAAILSNIAQIHLGFGDSGQAIGLFEQAVAAARQSGDRNVEASAMSSFGMAYHATGDDARSIETLEKSIAIHRELGDQHAAAIALNNLALVYNDTGEPQKALDTFAEVQSVFAGQSDADNEAVTLSNIGMVYRGLGANERAMSYYQQALIIFGRLNDDEARASTLNNVAVLQQSNGDTEEALSNYQQALTIVEKLGKRPEQASLLSAMGVANAERGEDAVALKLLQQSRDVAQQIGDPEAEALAVHNLGTEYERTGDLPAAMDELQKALPLWRRAHRPEFEAIALYVIARIELAQGLPASALQHVDESIRTSESLRGRISSEDLRASLFARATGAYELKTEILMRSSRLHSSMADAAEALQTSEQGRARSLLDLLTESHAHIRQGVDPQILRDEQLIRHDLSAKAVQQAKLSPDSQEYLELDHQIAKLTAAYEQRDAAIRTASPAYAALTQPRVLTLAEIQHLLDHDSLVLEYALGKDRGYVWAVTSSGLSAHELPAREIVEAAVRDFRDAIPQVANPQNFERASTRLGAMLLGPVVHELGRKRLIVVSDADLQEAVPFAALASPDAAPGVLRPLIIDHEIIQEPSASAVAALRSNLAGRATPQGLVAVFADPVVSATDPRLPPGSVTLHQTPPSIVPEAFRSTAAPAGLERLASTATEANSILKLAPPSGVLSRFGFDASKQAAEDPGLAGYRIVHFATHGLLDKRNPEFSGLALSLFKPDGTPTDGYLRLTDVFNLSLPVDLVVLSACESGQGKVVGGEGLVGLTRGFLYAGAGRLVVSLWKVDDTATAELMKEFYREMIGREHLSPSAALRNAQIAMLASGEWKHPFYWAPFIAEGGWQ
jgi:CHAT domain-containing protein